MLEALIDPNTGGVVAVKPVGSIWGKDEVNAVVLLDDSALEQSLSGKAHYVLPYACFKQKEMTFIDVNSGKSRVRVVRKLVSMSLVKVVVADKAAMSARCEKEGILRNADSDTGVFQTEIAKVEDAPVADPVLEPGVEVETNHPLPPKPAVEKNIDGTPVADDADDIGGVP